MNIYFKVSLYFIFIISLASCNTNRLQKKRYDTGELLSEFYLKDGKYEGEYKEFFKNGNLKEIHNYSEGNLVDSSIFFYQKPKEIIKRVVKILNDSTKHCVYYDREKTSKNVGLFLRDSIMINKWEYYRNGKLEKIIEFININGNAYPNQEWRYNENGDTIGGNFYEMIYRDTILKGEFKVLINLATPYFPKNTSKIMFCLSASDSIDFNYNFSNKGKFNYACSQDFETLKEDQEQFSNLDYNYVSEIFKKLKTSGNKIVRGIIYEYLVKDKDSLGLDKALENAHKMYFEIPVYVKDSL